MNSVSVCCEKKMSIVQCTLVGYILKNFFERWFLWCGANADWACDVLFRSVYCTMTVWVLFPHFGNISTVIFFCINTFTLTITIVATCLVCKRKFTWARSLMDYAICVKQFRAVCFNECENLQQCLFNSPVPKMDMCALERRFMQRTVRANTPSRGVLESSPLHVWLRG